MPNYLNREIGEPLCQSRTVGGQDQQRVVALDIMTMIIISGISFSIIVITLKIIMHSNKYFKLHSYCNF